MADKFKISIDYTKCIAPPKCRKCLQVCHLNVFRAFPPIPDRKGFSEKWFLDPEKKWRVYPYWTFMCIGCNKCVDLCPVKAIKVEPKR